jgi:hypothetical protein
VGAGRDQAGDVGDVGDEDRADLAGDRGERGEVDGARDRGAAGEQELGPLAQRQLADLVEVDAVGVGPHAVLDRAEVAAGDRHRPAVGQVAAGRQAQAHHGVARLEEGEVDGEVGGRARVGLDVGVVGLKQRLGPIEAELLDAVDDLLALVVALAGVALGVAVGQHGAGRGQDRRRHVVLRRDQADAVALQRLLGGEQVAELGIGGVDGVGLAGHRASLPAHSTRQPAPGQASGPPQPRAGGRGAPW